MESRIHPCGRWLRGLALAAVTVAPLMAHPSLAAAPASVRVVGCSPASLSADLLAAGVTAVTEAPDGETDDTVEEDQQPRIVGTIPKPRGVSEDDSRRLDALNLHTVSRDLAVAAALAALADPAQRTVKKAQLEGENGYLVWAVKTVRNDPASGPDPNLEAKVDAGGEGRVLSVECDAEDD